MGGLALPHRGRNQDRPIRDDEFLMKTRKQRRGGRVGLSTDSLEQADIRTLKRRKKKEEGMGGGGAEELKGKEKEKEKERTLTKVSSYMKINSVSYTHLTLPTT